MFISKVERLGREGTRDLNGCDKSSGIRIMCVHFTYFPFLVIRSYLQLFEVIRSYSQLFAVIHSYLQLFVVNCIH